MTGDVLTQEQVEQLKRVAEMALGQGDYEMAVMAHSYSFERFADPGSGIAKPPQLSSKAE